MQVKKRSGKLEKLNLNNIQKRLSSLAKGLNIQTDDIALRASQKMFDGVQTREIDEQLAKNTVNYSIHPDYNVLAGRICVSALHKETAVGQLLEDEKQLLEKIMLSGKVLEEENKYIQKLKNSLYDDKERERILERYLKGQKVSKENLSFLAKAPRFFKTVELLYIEGDVLEFQKIIDDKNTDEKSKTDLESLVKLLNKKLSGAVLSKTEQEKFDDYIIKKQDPENKNHFGIVNHRVYNVARENRKLIEDYMDYNRDFMFDFFGFKTLEKAYLLKSFKVVSKVREITEDTGEVIKKYVKETVGSIVERPQDTFMRVALAINGDNSFKRVFELYDLLSKGYYTHATPTLFNAGLNREQMSSCFLLANKSDSIDGIFDTYKEEAEISKNSGGIGVWYHNVRSNGSQIKGTNGTSGGIIPFLTIKNAIARSIDQGGKRKGSIAVYLEPWHADVKDFIQLRKNTGIEEKRTRNLFLALWVPNLFYKRVEQGGKWSLFDPATAPGLHDLVGDAFESKYEEYEKLGLAIETLDAREFFKDIFEVQIETGLPYILNKDYANMKSNQQNLGVIKSSNLCTEIIEYSDEKETAVCNLASLCLPKFVKKDENGEWNFDHKELHEVTSIATYNLNRVIDKNYYVNDATERSNMRHRPIGLGVQGLADVFFKMRVRYDSEIAQKINEEIFETIYHAAVTESLRLAKRDGHYTSMKENGGAPITKGILQFDLWDHTPSSDRYEWDKVKEEVKTHGLRNSLLVAPMPTASTSQIFNNTESFEPLTEHLYKRKTLSGEFVVANKYLIRHLEELGLWGDEVVEHLINENGSIKNLKIVPEEVRDIYPTVWELSLKVQIDMAADRGAYICQSQSFNVHMDSPSMERMKDVYMYSWKKKLKTQSYYFRTNAATTNQKVTVKRQGSQAIEEDDDCEVCGS